MVARSLFVAEITIGERNRIVRRGKPGSERQGLAVLDRGGLELPLRFEHLAQSEVRDGRHGVSLEGGAILELGVFGVAFCQEEAPEL